MRVNQNSSRKVGLYSELDPDHLAMGKLSAHGTRLGTTAETRNSISRNTCKTDDKNQIKTQFVSSQSFHRTPGGRVQEIIAEERFEL
jgi:hypothetical protein